jgi:MFS family permease
MTIGDTGSSRKTQRTVGLDAKWLAELTPGERNTLIATFGGWALDGMDVMAYSFVVPTLMTTWHITGGEAGLLGTIALLISAAGGWLAGFLADRLRGSRFSRS